MIVALRSFLGLVGIWAFLIGWAVVFVFDDLSAAGNVSAIVMSPVVLLPLPGLVFIFALCFWGIVSLLALTREIPACRRIALWLLVAHWLGALYMLGRDVLVEGGAARIGQAFWSHPSLFLFLLTYAAALYYIWKVLAGDTAEPT
jgi:hypothetical protein